MTRDFYFVYKGTDTFCLPKETPVYGDEDMKEVMRTQKPPWDISCKKCDELFPGYSIKSCRYIHHFPGRKHIAMKLDMEDNWLDYRWVALCVTEKTPLREIRRAAIDDWMDEFDAQRRESGGCFGMGKEFDEDDFKVGPCF